MKGDLYFAPRKSPLVILTLAYQEPGRVPRFFWMEPRKDVLMDLDITENMDHGVMFQFLHVGSGQRVWIKPEDLNTGRLEILSHNVQLEDWNYANW